MKSTDISRFGTRLATTTALVSLAFAYGARNTARAGVCVPGGGGTYSCVGPAGPDVTQSFSNTGISVTTTPGFGLSTGGGQLGFSIFSTGAAGLSFDDSGNPAGSAITSGYEAIRAVSTGGGPISINTGGPVSSTYNYSGNAAHGIVAINSTGSSDVTITTNGTVNSNSGSAIYTNTFGSSGDTVITTNAAVSSGGGYNGSYRTVYAFAYSTTSDITISTSDVTNQRANSRGIYAVNNANGNTNVDITVSGAVSIGAGSTIGYGVAVQKQGSGTINVTLDAGADVSGGGDAILFGGASSANTLTVNAGGGFTGSARMFGASNDVVINGGDMSNVTTITANLANDAVTIGAGTTTVSGSQFVNFETFTVGAGGTANLNGTLNVNTVSVDAGGTLSAGASPGQANIVGDLDLGAGATTLVELAGLIAGTQYDQIDVSGGTASLASGSTFDVDFFGGFTAGLGDSFDILVADSISVVDFNTITFDFSGALLGAGLGWHVELIDSTRDTLQISVVEESAELPEPSMLLLFGAGALGIIGMRRRRKTS